MEYEESYHGERIIITTEKNAAGAWTAKAEQLDAQEQRVLLAEREAHPSEEEAKRAALSAAAEAIDRTRISRGKP
jgi:hypothetical protein